VGAGIGMILKTANGGSSWQTVNTGSQNLLISLDFVNTNVGWAVGTFGEIQKTTDGGNTWQTQTGVFPPDWLYSVTFLDENTGWTVGFDGKVQETDDGGATWALQTSGTPYQLNSVCFVDKLHGWAVGENGTILKYALGITSVGDNEIVYNQPSDFILYDNYPNPFNPSTTIKYSLPIQSKVTLSIYNILGQEIRTLVDEVQSSGIKTISWNGRDNHGKQVSSGIYLYRIQSGVFTATKKMVLVE
jgi:hypothetical protein